MKRTWTIIGVADVTRSYNWYQALFGQPPSAPAHDYFGQILDTDGTVLLCLHEWGSHEHPTLHSPDRGEPGNGLLLFFRVDDFDAALARARTLVSRLEEEPQVNPATGTREFALRDPEGYYVMVSALTHSADPAERESVDVDPISESRSQQRAAVKLHELIDAFDFASAGEPFEHGAYLNLEAGTFHFESDPDEELPEDIEDPDRYVAIPHKHDLNLGKRLALAFVEEALPDALDDVRAMFQRKGAYSRFKTLLERRRMLERWYEYEAKATREALRDWCEDHGINLQD
jgi:catechol 2,3-dioxygenase-like lactoylglutathione lyase family enzyme